MHFKKLILAIAATFVIATSASAQTAPLNIAVVDFDKVLRTATAPKGIAAQVRKTRETYRAEVLKEEEGLRTSQQDLVKKQSLLSADAFQEERRKFEQNVQATQKKIQQKNIRLQEAQKKANGIVLNNLREVILKLSQERSYSLVLRRAQTAIVADKLDISDEVIARLNKKLPKVDLFKK